MIRSTSPVREIPHVTIIKCFYFIMFEMKQRYRLPQMCRRNDYQVQNKHVLVDQLYEVCQSHLFSLERLTVIKLPGRLPVSNKALALIIGLVIVLNRRVVTNNVAHLQNLLFHNISSRADG